MFIVWGSKVRFSETGRGEFHCPRCGADRGYVRQLARRWFTLFWIPLVPGKHLGEVVECDSCHARFDPGVLNAPTTADSVRNLGFARRAIAARMVDLTDNTTVARQAAIAWLRTDVPNYDDAQLDTDRAAATADAVSGWANHIAAVLNSAGAEQLVLGATRVAMADGALSDVEREEITSLATTLGLTPMHVDGIFTKAATAASRPNE